MKMKIYQAPRIRVRKLAKSRLCTTSDSTVGTYNPDKPGGGDGAAKKQFFESDESTFPSHKSAWD